MKERCRKLTLTLAIGVLSLGIEAIPALAEEEKPTADLTVGVYSDYVWRGWIFSDDSIVIQPSMTVGYKGFAMNVWGNLDTDLDEDEFGGGDTNKWNETDITLSYDGSTGMVGYSLGYIYYALDGTEDSQEVYAGVSLDTILSPTLTIYNEIANYRGYYVTLDVSHSIPLSETLRLDLGAKVSYYDADKSTLTDSDGDAYDALHDGVLSASITFPINEYLSITPELYYSFPLSDDAEDEFEASNPSGDEDIIFGGVSMSFSF
ncbi:MAG: hypothetical protein KAQ71_15075, partial [Desulfobulbaceae bacterium]|nr:hypothetical protein [Desulfobulbaceae bacterium]